MKNIYLYGDSDTPSYIAIGGYSLAGLFTTYVAFESDAFSGVIFHLQTERTK